MKQFLFVLGTNPYENCHGDYHTRGNGEWFTTASNLAEALQIIFNSMDYPSEPTGRKEFVPGTSLEGVHENDVIQVWSDEPDVRQRTADALGEKINIRGLHSGNGHEFGLACEVKVTDLDKYCTPVRALLTAPDAPGNPEKSLSPMGASVLKYHEVKHEIKMACQVQKMEVTKKQWEVEAMADEMKEKMKLMEEQIGVFDAYLHGTRHRTQMCRGTHGSGKYKVYQNRVFLSEEISLLGNFRDMDFADMEALEKWLIKSSHIWRMLPHERCILATRIRQEKKDYGDPLANIWNNMANMQNMIWIRDGQNVFHVDVEYDFHNAIFPHKNQFDRARTVVQDSLYTRSFKWSPPKNWQGEKLKEGEFDVQGLMKRKPLEDDEPYCIVREQKNRFHSMEEWLASEYYTPLLDQQINEAVNDYLRERNKKQMLFAVIIQGIVDNTSYLEIPKGTDMFSWESVNCYLDLLYDYSHGLPFKGWAEKVAPYIDGKVTAGDWIVALVNEYISKDGYGHGKTIKESRWMLLKVVGLEEVTERRMTDANEHKDCKVKKPVVKYHPKATRWSRSYENYEAYQKARTKAPMTLVLKASSFMRVPMSPQSAKDILDDRDWKRKHTNLVPLMVNYKHIINAMKTPVNGTILKWDKFDE